MSQVNETFLVLCFHFRLISAKFVTDWARLNFLSVGSAKLTRFEPGWNSSFVTALTMPNEQDDNQTTNVVNGAAPSNVPPG